MERLEVGDDERLSALVEAATRGEEAVITRGGEVVASVLPRTTGLRTRDGREPQRGIDWAALERLHASLPDAILGKGPSISEMRDMDEH